MPPKSIVFSLSATHKNGPNGAHDTALIDTGRHSSLFVPWFVQIDTGFQTGAVSTEYPSTDQFFGDLLLNNVVKNLPEDLAVTETTTTFLTQG